MFLNYFLIFGATILRFKVIKFIAGEDIKEDMLIEIIVGNKKDKRTNYVIQDLNESFGNLMINPKSYIIVKVPKEYDENVNNFSIIQDFIYRRCYIDISYDKIEFKPFNFDNHKDYISSKIIPPLSVNPYSYIPKNSKKSDEKFFYILIYNPYFNEVKSIYIKKPKLYTDIKLKQINTFPQLKGEEEK